MSGALRSVDFYSGAGGWSLGLRMAGIEIVNSYERWSAANETNAFNNDHAVIQCDIRGLKTAEIPKTPIIVGSPPCTQFSLSNRGGSGNVVDGLSDIAAFLNVVEQLKPKWWVMENVPSVLDIVTRELLAGGRLEAFRGLNLQARIFDMAEFGLPQRRRRCLVGNIDFDLLESYSRSLPRRTLGDIVNAFSGDVLKDPLYGLTLEMANVIDHVPETFLNIEEERINRAVKALHPVYNNMQFPDQLHRPSRTITATCTRVSRESIVIEAPEGIGAHRRLTIRERAIAQGFPINFQFLANTHSQKLRMVGNALPPLFAFYVGHAIRGTCASALPAPVVPLERWRNDPRVCSSKPEIPAFKYRATRKFRFAVPSLRMKSGMRFELTNGQGSEVDWHVGFVFGTSKRIRHMRPDVSTLNKLRQSLPDVARIQIDQELSAFDDYLRNVDVKHLQDVWCHVGPGLTRPLILLDEISTTGERLTELLEPLRPLTRQLVEEILQDVNLEKGRAHAPRIIAGMMIASMTNDVLTGAAKRVPDSAELPQQKSSTG